MTSKAAVKTTTARHDKEPQVAGTLALDALDTAWRVALPIIAAAVAGIAGDRHFATGPWITLGATLVGLGVSAVLIKRQLAALEKEDKK